MANPLVIGLAAFAGLFLLRQNAAATTAKQQAIKTGAQTSSTPTSVAAALGAFVAGYTKNATPTVRTDNVVGFDWKPYADAMTKAGRDYAANNPSLGTWTFGTGFANTDSLWKPSVSLVNSPGAMSDTADAFPFGPIYDIGSSFRTNPGIGAASYDFGGG